jgi:hypothetical protein
MSFIVDSDIHFGYETARDNLKPVAIRPDKKDNVSKIISKINNNPDLHIQNVILAGDITNSGYDGKSAFCGKMKWKFGGDWDELGPCIKEYIHPIEKYTNTNAIVRPCAGNHDTYVKFPSCRKPVFSYIRQKCGKEWYAFDISPELRAICCHIYPKKGESLDFLKKELIRVVKQSRFAIIFFHYNLTGAFSGDEWWTSVEKAEFYHTIYPFRTRIPSIIVGHHHTSEVSKWNGIQVINAGGNKLALCTFDKKSEKINVEYF